MTDFDFTNHRLDWLEVAPHGKFADLAELAQWESLKARILRHACYGRNCTVITADPQTWSVSNDFPECVAMTVGRIVYHVASVNQLAEEDIHSIAECPDFNLGTLWVVIDTLTEARLSKLIVDQKERGFRPPFTRERLLMCEKDGDILYWMNPDLKQNDLRTQLAE